MPEDSRPVLYLVACGAYPAGQLPAFVRDTQAQGWDVCVIATPNGLKFLDEGNIAGLSGHPVRTRYKRPDEPDLLPSPDALVVAPATFNTVNKWAQGISDTLALGLLNEAVGLGLPMIAAPWPNAALAAHPVFIRSVGLLREWGVTVLLDLNRLPRPRSTAWPARGFPGPDGQPPAARRHLPLGRAARPAAQPASADCRAAESRAPESRAPELLSRAPRSPGANPAPYGQVQLTVASIVWSPDPVVLIANVPPARSRSPRGP